MPAIPAPLTGSLANKRCKTQSNPFNAGDRAFWFHPRSYIPFRGTADTWKDTFVALLADKGVTDIVLYGDPRPIHAQAVAEAKARGYDTKVMKKIVALRKRDRDDVAEEEAILEMYKSALGMG